MKRAVLCIIYLLLIVVVGGCTPVYYYQPGKTLEQCAQDFLECEHAGPAGIIPLFYPWCMESRGYRDLTKEKLPAGIRTRQVHLFSLLYVAGQ